MGSIKSFVGLAGYFRRHIKNYGELIRPLEKLTEGYQKKYKSKKINWSEDQIQAFKNVQDAIVKCQILYYRDTSAPLRLYTDASDYGIGGYLCQVVNGDEQPIAFLSKTLSKAEKRWSVYEKEAFAIFYSLRKREHFLQDSKFTLFTDHKNLTYLNKDPSPKVQRWRIAVQEYNFDVAYIEGKKNIIADGFSRLCPKELEPELEQPIKSIAMFLNSYPIEEKVIDEAFSILVSRELERETFQITPEYEWEAKQCLSDRATEFNFLRSKQQKVGKNSSGYKMTKLHALLTVKENIYHHIPDKYYEIISKCHNSTVGHWGVEETLARVKKYIETNKSGYQDLTWLTMRKDVDNFIQKCPCCQLNREKKFQIDTKKYTTSKFGLFKNLSIDAIFVPQSKAWHKYIFVIIDACSRYVNLVPLKDLTAESAARELIIHMARFGIPNQICTDNSTQFKSKFEEVLKVLEIHNYKIQPYSHQENSIVERANKEVLRHLRNFIYDTKVIDEWPEYLPQVERLMNSHVSKSTGVSPADMVFAGQIDLNAGILFPN